MQIISSSGQEAEWPPFGKELFTRLTVHSNYDMSIRNLVIQGVQRGMILVVKFLIFLKLFLLALLLLYLSLVVRKPAFGVSDQVRHKLGCTAIEDG